MNVGNHVMKLYICIKIQYCLCW